MKPGQLLTFRSRTITIVAYDDQDQDGDTISVFFNGAEVVQRQMLFLRDNDLIVRTLDLRPGQKNSFVVKAWNIGRPGSPNTLKIEFYEGAVAVTNARSLRRRKPIYTRTMNARPGLSASMDFFCNP